MTEKTFTVDQRKEMFEAFNANPAGAFISITGYEPVTGEGEKADYVLQSGIHYDNIAKTSIDLIKEIQKGRGVAKVHVKCNTWKCPDGTFTNRKAKDRTLVTFEKDYSVDEPEFQNACAEILDALVNPKHVEQPYEKEANGVYSIDGEVLYIRECLIINKTITQPGARPVSATEPYTALKRVIRDMLPVSNYRTFKLDGRFEKVTINHTDITST